MIRRHLGNILIAAGLVLIAWPAATWAYGLYWQERLAAGFSRTLSEGARPAASAHASPKAKQKKKRNKKRKRKSPPAGEAFARLKIERIKLKAIVVEGVDNVALRRGPGHLPKTALPGEDSNCAIAAHRDGWFERLPQVRVGDSVWVETPEYNYEHVVDRKKVVTPDRGDLLKTGPKPKLTLITCTGPNYPHSAYRLLVFCNLKGSYPR